MAKSFGVSSTPVREAFAVLEREGLLVSAPHKGVVVFQPTIEDLRETYDIRIPLEVLATERAVARIEDKDLIALDQLLAQMAASTERLADYGRLNQVFHERLYAVARLPKLEEMIHDLREASAAYLLLFSTASLGAHDTQGEHERIVVACHERDPEAAGQAVRAHLCTTVERVSAQLPATSSGRA